MHFYRTSRVFFSEPLVPTLLPVAPLALAGAENEKVAFPFKETGSKEVTVNVAVPSVLVVSQRAEVGDCRMITFRSLLALV